MSGRASDLEREGHRVLSRDLPWDGSVLALTLLAEPIHKFRDDQVRTAILGPEVKVVLEGLRPLTVHVVDAETSDLVEPDALEAYGKRRKKIERTDVGQYRYLAAGKENAYGRVELTAKPGWVAWDHVSWNVPRSAYADELEVVAPLRREVPVRVTVLDHELDISNDAEITHFGIAGRTRAPKSRRDAYGTHRLDGVPYFRGERLTVTAEIADTTARESASAILGSSPDQLVELEIRLPRPLPKPDHGTIGIGGGAGGTFHG